MACLEHVCEICDHTMDVYGRCPGCGGSKLKPWHAPANVTEETTTKETTKEET